MFNSSEKFEKYLLIGSIPYGDRPDTIGGATVLFNEFLDFLNSKDIKFDLIVANKFKNKYISLIYIFKSLFELRHKNKIVLLNVSRNGLTLLYPLVFIFCKFFSMKIVLRVFGSHALDVIQISKIKTLLLYIIKRTELILVETKFLVEEFSKINKNVIWFPNNRKSNKSKNKSEFKKRFVFLGHIKKEKGILDLIEVFKLLDDDYHFSFYGSIEKELLFLAKHPNYEGLISSDKVFDILRINDVLVLPTYYDGEGYPGVIIEAYMLGLPVISTNWRSIPEIVENYKTGILIEPKNREDLKNSILYFNDLNYPNFRVNVGIKAKDFDSTIIHQRIFETISRI